MNPQWPYSQFSVPPLYPAQPLQQHSWTAIHDPNLAPPAVNNTLLPNAFPSHSSFPFHVPPPNIISTKVPPPTFCPNFLPPNYQRSINVSSHFTESFPLSVELSPPLPSDSPPPLPSEPPPPLPPTSPPPLPLDSPPPLPTDSSVFPVQLESSESSSYFLMGSCPPNQSSTQELTESSVVMYSSASSLPVEIPSVSTVSPAVISSDLIQSSPTLPFSLPLSIACSASVISESVSFVSSSTVPNNSLPAPKCDISTLDVPSESLSPGLAKPINSMLAESLTTELMPTLPSSIVSVEDKLTLSLESSVASFFSANSVSTSSHISEQSISSSAINDPVSVTSNLPQICSQSTEILLPNSAVSSVEPVKMSCLVSTEEQDKIPILCESSIVSSFSAENVSTDSSHVFKQSASSTINNSISAESNVPLICVVKKSSKSTEILFSNSTVSSSVESTKISCHATTETLTGKLTKSSIPTESLPTISSRLLFDHVKSSDTALSIPISATYISTVSSPIVNQSILPSSALSSSTISKTVSSVSSKLQSHSASTKKLSLNISPSGRFIKVTPVKSKTSTLIKSSLLSSKSTTSMPSNLSSEQQYKSSISSKFCATSVSAACTSTEMLPSKTINSTSVLSTVHPVSNPFSVYAPGSSGLIKEFKIGFLLVPKSVLDVPINSQSAQSGNKHVLQIINRKISTNFPRIISPVTTSTQNTASCDNEITEQFASKPTSFSEALQDESAFIHFAEAMISQPPLPVNKTGSSKDFVQHSSESDGQKTVNILRRQILREHDYCFHDLSEHSESNLSSSEDISNQQSNEHSPIKDIPTNFLAAIITQDHDYCLPSNEPGCQYVLKKEIDLDEGDTYQPSVSPKVSCQIQMDFSSIEDLRQELSTAKHGDSMDKNYNLDCEHNRISLNNKTTESEENTTNELKQKLSPVKHEDSMSKNCNLNFKGNGNNKITKPVKDNRGFISETKHVNFESETYLSTEGNSDENSSLEKENCNDSKVLDSNFCTVDKLHKSELSEHSEQTKNFDSKTENTEKYTSSEVCSFNNNYNLKSNYRNEHNQVLSFQNHENQNNEMSRHLNNAEKSDCKNNHTNFTSKISKTYENVYFKTGYIKNIPNFENNNSTYNQNNSYKTQKVVTEIPDSGGIFPLNSYRGKDSIQNITSIIEIDNIDLQHGANNIENKKHDHSVEATKSFKFAVSENNCRKISDSDFNQAKCDEIYDITKPSKFDYYNSKLRKSYKDFDDIWEKRMRSSSNESSRKRRYSHSSEDERKRERSKRRIHSTRNSKAVDYNHAVEYRKNEHSHLKRKEHTHSSEKKSDQNHSARSHRKNNRSPHLSKSPRKHRSGSRRHSPHLKKIMDEQNERILVNTKHYHSNKSPESIKNNFSHCSVSPKSVKSYDCQYTKSFENLMSSSSHQSSYFKSKKNLFERSPEDTKMSKGLISNEKGFNNQDIDNKDKLPSLSRDVKHSQRDDSHRHRRRHHRDHKARRQHRSLHRSHIPKDLCASVSKDNERSENNEKIYKDNHIVSSKEKLQSPSRSESFRNKERLRLNKDQNLKRQHRSRHRSRHNSSTLKELSTDVTEINIKSENTEKDYENKSSICKRRLLNINRSSSYRSLERYKRNRLIRHHRRNRRRSSTPQDLPCLSLKTYKYVCSTVADDYYYSKEKDSKEVIAKDKLKDLHEKFKYELVERAEKVRASKPKYEPPKRKTKLRKPKPPKTDSNSDSSSSSEKSSSEEEDTAMEELERKKKHPYRLHLELWFNDPKEMNDGPLCRCSAKARRAGIRHGIYVGEDHLPLCDPMSNNVDKLYHYRITMTPHTNFLTKNPTTIYHNGQGYRFEGFSMFSHSKLPTLPNCKVIRFNYEYTIVYAEEEFPKNFTIQGLELFSKYLLVEILELVDLNWNAYDDSDGCPRFHFMPRFARELKDGGKELLSHCYVLDYLLKQNEILIDGNKLSEILNVDNLKWQDLADEVKGMIVTCPGMKPSSIRVDQLDREQCLPVKEEFPVIVHFGVRPPQLSYAGNPHYQKAWRDYVKYRHLLANKPKVRYADRHKLMQKESRLQEMRMENDLKRDVTVVISSKSFYKTGIMSDIVQHAMLLPVLVCHLRFHQSLTHLENKLGYEFKDRFLLQLALTHPSYRENFGTNPDHARNSLTNCGLRQPQYGDRRIHYMNTRKRGINTLINIMSRFGSRKETLSRINHNERLEFLGDAVVEFLSSIHLFYMFPDLEEGGLATYRAAIVQNQHLAVLSKKLELDRFMLYAHGSDLCHDLELRHAMANCFEALMGALFLDNGIEIADKVFSKTLFSEPELLEVWMNFSPHPLQEQEPGGDRKWIASVPLLQKLHRFEETIGIEFNHIRLLARALTHRSLGYNNLTLGSNQRLEFLGDTVLQLVASEYLYKFFPEHHEGHLSLLRSSLVNNRTQAVVCADLGMVDYAIYPDNKVELKPKDKADLLEAFLGALYVDKDLGYCRKFCEVCFFPRLQDFIMNQDWNDPKSKLQQCCLTLRSMDGGEPDIPTYKVIECKGPTNTRVYSVAVYFQGNRLAVGSGHSIQQAEMDAASNALNMSKDLFPQLRHQRRAIERSLKKRPHTKSRHSPRQNKEKISERERSATKRK